MSRIIVSGSTAFDNIMYSNTNIKNHLIKKEIGSINISYIISGLKKYNGGTGANIAYNLSLLETNSILFSNVGNDYEFSDIMKEYVDLKYINYSKHKLTAKSYITVDKNDNQITALYPGAMEELCEIKNFNIKDTKYAIVSANNIYTIKKHLKIFHNNGVKTFFDPGQQITQMTKEELEYCFKFSDYIIINEYEYELIKKISEKTDGEMIEMFEFMILTYGIQGSKIFDNKYNIIEIPGVKNSEFIDSTGAGDAYRAGLLKGLNDGYSIEISAKIGAVLASFSTGKHGAQSHFINWKQFKNLYKETFGEEL